MVRTKTRFLELLVLIFLAISSTAAYSMAHWGTCNRQCFYLQQQDGSFDLVCVCAGSCTHQDEECATETEWLAGGGWNESCYCRNTRTGRRNPVDPPCAGKTNWNSRRGFTVLPCDLTEKCGVDGDITFFCEDQWWFPAEPGQMRPVCYCPEFE